MREFCPHSAGTSSCHPGFLKAFQVGNACCLRLFKPPAEGELGAVPELFAECAVRLDNGRTLQVYVESVIDSSRWERSFTTAASTGVSSPQL